MPEGFIPLAETVIYLSLAPKSNSAYAAYIRAKNHIEDSGIEEVPIHLKNPSSLLEKKWEYGKGYRYPHSVKEGWVEQEYLPSRLKEKKFYVPKKHGKEPLLLRWINYHKLKK